MDIQKKRQDYISWKEYFMGIAQLSARRSKDPSSQVGACIVNNENKILGIGYNGLPHGLEDDTFNWSRTNDFLDSKYPYICHAEMNAILNSIQLNSLKDSTIYTTLFPCNECTKLIIQSGIKHVIYLEDKYPEKDVFLASKILLDKCKIKIEKYI
jgi:dCMP deaminase